MVCVRASRCEPTAGSIPVRTSLRPHFSALSSNLGAVSHNVGAGMTGGALYLLADHDAEVNKGYVSQCELSEQNLAELRSMIAEYFEATGSETARVLLNDHSALRQRFRRYIANGEYERTQRMREGTHAA